jgi:hypothetical protein
MSGRERELGVVVVGSWECLLFFGWEFGSCRKRRLGRFVGSYPKYLFDITTVSKSI